MMPDEIWQLRSFAAAAPRWSNLVAASLALVSALVLPVLAAQCRIIPMKQRP